MASNAARIAAAQGLIKRNPRRLFQQSEAISDRHAFVVEHVLLEMFAVGPRHHRRDVQRVDALRQQAIEIARFDRHAAFAIQLGRIRSIGRKVQIEIQILRRAQCLDGDGNESVQLRRQFGGVHRTVCPEYRWATAATFNLQRRQSTEQATELSKSSPPVYGGSNPPLEPVRMHGLSLLSAAKAATQPPLQGKFRNPMRRREYSRSRRCRKGPPR